MIYPNLDEIIKIINKEKEIIFYKINRNILTIDYWQNKIILDCRKCLLEDDVY
jgi:hypothetical protein